MSRKVSLKFFIIAAAAFLLALPFLSFSQECAYDPKGKRDPFLSLVTPDGRLLRLEGESSAEQLKIEGIIYNEGGASEAIINDNIVKEGDIVDGYRIIKIEENKVVFEKDGKTLDKGLKKEEE